MKRYFDKSNPILFFSNIYALSAITSYTASLCIGSYLFVGEVTIWFFVLIISGALLGFATLVVDPLIKCTLGALLIFLAYMLGIFDLQNKSIFFLTSCFGIAAFWEIIHDAILMVAPKIHVKKNTSEGVQFNDLPLWKHYKKFMSPILRCRSEFPEFFSCLRNRINECSGSSSGEYITITVEHIVSPVEILTQAFENMILGSFKSNEMMAEGKITKLFNFITDSYKLSYDDCSYYVRELDPLSKYYTGPKSTENKYNLAKSFLSTYIDSFLYFDEPKRFHELVIKYRRGLSPTFLFRAAVILRFGYNIIPDFKIFSVMFGGRLESIVSLEKARSIGAITINEHFRKFFKEQKLVLKTDNMITVLDEVIQQYEVEKKDWFYNLLSEGNWKVEFNYKLKRSNSYETYPSDIFYCNKYNEKRVGKPHIYKNHSFHGRSQQLFPLALNYDYYNNGDEDWTPDHLIQVLAKQIGLNKLVRNYIREFLGFPLIGTTRWISELTLLAIVRKMTNEIVIHQWSPIWLGRQRIDVGIPSLNIGFEYQGRQHYEAVDYFGGEEAFKTNKQRDERKLFLCNKNQVKLIHISYQLDWNEIEAIVWRELETSL